MIGTSRAMLFGLALAALVACAGPGGEGLRGGSGSTTGKASIPPAGKWSKSWPVSGNYAVSASWAAGSHPVNAYVMTETEWNKWQAGASPESLTVIDKKLGAATGELSGRVAAGTTLVLVFENTGSTPYELQWWGSFGGK